jgi:hypothetical protein
MLPYSLHGTERVMTTLVGPVASSHHAPGIVSPRQAVLPTVRRADASSELQLRRRARRQGAVLLAFSSLISLGGIVALLTWIF